MTQHLKLRIHVSEPFDFERQAGRVELEGWTVDHIEDDDEWEVHLEEGFDFREHHYGRVLVSPHYVGEHLSRVHDAIVGFPVRIAHRQDGDWHYAMTGMLSIRHDDDTGMLAIRHDEEEKKPVDENADTAEDGDNGD